MTGGNSTGMREGTICRPPRVCVDVAAFQMDHQIALLQKSELFDGVSEDLLRSIHRTLQEVSYEPGEIVFKQGDLGDAVYVVASGTLSLEVEGVTLLYREPGECVGEFALIDDEPRSATAVALTAVTLLRWERSSFQQSLAQHAEVVRGIFRMLTGKLRQDIDSKVRMQLERERWQQDLARAREIQMGMLPASHLTQVGLEIHGFCRPAAEVGGDYYDYFPLADEKVALIIGDVTGHGFYSGLFVAMAKSCIHTQSEFSFAPSAVMTALRRTLDLSIYRQLLMTCCYVLFDLRAATMSYANAGHPYPYLYRNATQSLEELEALDPILGALDLDQSSRFEERTLDWHPGDVLVMYSDGITESRNARGEMFDHERLEACSRGLAGGSALAIKDGILDAVAQYSAGVAQGDDLTLVVAKGV